MEPITMAIVAALAAGASDTTKTAISDAYKGLKSLLARKLGMDSHIPQLIEQFEKEPDSEVFQKFLDDRFKKLTIENDQEIVKAVEHLKSVIGNHNFSNHTNVVQVTGQGGVGINYGETNNTFNNK